MRKYWKIIIGGALFLALVAGLVYYLWTLHKNPGRNKFSMEAQVESLQNNSVKIKVNYGTSTIKDFRGKEITVDLSNSLIIYSQENKVVGQDQIKNGEQVNIKGSIKKNKLTAEYIKINKTNE